MSESLYAVVFTPQQIHNLMQLVNKGILKPTNSFETVEDNLHFSDDTDETEPWVRVYVHIFNLELSKDFFESVAKYISEMFHKKGDNITCIWHEVGGMFQLYYNDTKTSEMRSIQESMNIILSDNM